MTTKLNRATILDVAKKAGVSHTTVSRVIRSSNKVSNTLTERVHAAMRALDYQPNIIAGALVSSYTPIVPVIMPQLGNAVFSDLIHEITDTLGANGYQVLLGSRFYSQDQEDKLIHTFLGWSPAGMILAGASLSEQAREWLTSAEIPVAQVIGQQGKPINIAVDCDHRQAGYELACHLIKKGYRKFAFAGTRLEYDLRARMRLEGMQKAVKEMGLGEPVIISGGQERTSYAVGRALTEQALAKGDNVDIIYAASDILAVGAMMEIQSRGLTFGDDIGVSGFGGLEIAKAIYPKLTTVEARFGYMGKRAAELLMTQIGRKPVAVHKDVGFTIIDGGSA